MGGLLGRAGGAALMARRPNVLALASRVMPRLTQFPPTRPTPHQAGFLVVGPRRRLTDGRPASVAGHGVVPQELGHSSCDGLGTLDVQEMADAIDRAVLDVRE